MLAVMAAAGSIYFVGKYENYEYTRKLSEKLKPTVSQTVEPQNTKIPDITITPTQVPTTTKSPAQQISFSTSGWIPSFDFNNGLQSAIANKPRISSVHYAAASVAENGTISWNNGFDVNVKKLNDTGIPFGINVISISEIASRNLLTSQANKDTFLNRLKEVKTSNNNFSAINLNIEKLSLENKKDFVTFIKDAKQELSPHKIAVDVTFYGQDGDINNPYDYAGIGEYADQVIIMAYDYTLKSNKKAGFEEANAPDFWVEYIAQYAIKSIPKEKLSIGLPLYGYSYNIASGKRISSYTYSQIQNILKSQNTQPLFQGDGWGEKYIDKGTERIFFQDKDTLSTKKAILTKYGINKVFYWRFGGEGDLLQ